LLKTCLKCGKEFNGHHSKQKYCSRNCSNPIINPKICPKCEQLFKPKHKEQRYCSRQCYDSGFRWGIEQTVKDVETTKKQEKESGFYDEWAKAMNRLSRDKDDNSIW